MSGYGTEARGGNPKPLIHVTFDAPYRCRGFYCCTLDSPPAAGCRWRLPVLPLTLIRWRCAASCLALALAQARVVVEVEARVTKPEAVDSFVTNTFTFVYELKARPGSPLSRLKRVLPTCEEEAVRSWRARQL
jgi:hypothetical protein